jgi:hypothetical protein
MMGHADQVFQELLATHGDTPEVRRLAETAAAFWAQAETAHAIVAAEGLVVTNSKGTFVHPAVTVEKCARQGFLATIRTLRARPKRDKLGRPGMGEQLTAHLSKYITPTAEQAAAQRFFRPRPARTTRRRDPA